MSTVINNPASGEDSSGVVNALVGIIILVLALVLFFLYGLPMLRNSNTPAPAASEPNSLDVNVTIPNNEVLPTQPQPTQ